MLRCFKRVRYFDEKLEFSPDECAVLKQFPTQIEGNVLTVHHACQHRWQWQQRLSYYVEQYPDLLKAPFHFTPGQTWSIEHDL